MAEQKDIYLPVLKKNTGKIRIFRAPTFAKAQDSGLAFSLH